MSRSRAGRQGVSGEGLGLGRPPAVTRGPPPAAAPLQWPSGTVGRRSLPAGSLGEQPPAARSPAPVPSRHRILAEPLRSLRLAPCAPGSGALLGAMALGGLEMPEGGPEVA